MAKNDKYEKERQRRTFFHEANEEYSLTKKAYDDLSEEDKVRIVRQLRQIKNTAYLDRNKWANFKKYMLSNPIYFEDIFRRPCTKENITEEYNLMKKRGYEDDSEESPVFAGFYHKSGYWRSRETA